MYKITLKDTLSLDLNDLPGEIWSEIPGYENRYQISNYGRVKSIILKKHSIIKKTLSSGKFKVTLSNKKRFRKNGSVGRITAAAFLREPKENEVIRYKDRNVLFDAVINLEWIPRKESSQEAYKNGRFPKDHSSGIKNGMSKLRPDQILQIRNKRKQGISNVELSKVFGVSYSCIDNVVNRRRWKSV